MDYSALSEKKRRLDGFRPLPVALVDNLDAWFRVELTYTSNAIEGNTLTRRETALVVEKGLTVGGKTLVEHLEASNHAKAIDWIYGQTSRRPEQLVEQDILGLHAIVLKAIDDTNAGRYRNVAVRIAGSPVVLPNPAKVPELMKMFQDWLSTSGDLHPVARAAEAHYRLVTIHPFVDGNGRAARLLMNLILLMDGYPPALIRKRDRLAYIASLEKAQLGGSSEAYLKLIAKAVDRTLDIYLSAARGDSHESRGEAKLLKIGALARQAGVANSTIRHWTKEGLLDVAEVTEAGYQLYASDLLERIVRIRALQEQRYTLLEIKKALDG